MNTGSFVNGNWFHPKSNRLVRNLNPADPDDVIGEFPAATVEDVQNAIDHAQAASRGWRKTPGPERGRVLWRAADIARRRADEIARTLTREEGKVLKEAKGEVMKGISLLEFYAGEGFRMHGKTLPSEARDTFTYTIRQPLGVVGLIAPWNFPWAIPVWKSAPALGRRQLRHLQTRRVDAGDGDLTHGNLRRSRPSSRRVQHAGGFGLRRRRSDGQSPVLRAISFTGSNEIGGALYVKAAQRGAKVTCEMGGKNAVIVMADADLDKAAVAIHGGAFGSTGQRCTATSRVIAVACGKGCAGRTARRSGEENQARARAWMKPSIWGRRWTKNNGRPIWIISISAGKEGARLLLGGNTPDQLGKGYFVEPTIFDNVAPTHAHFQRRDFRSGAVGHDGEQSG